MSTIFTQSKNIPKLRFPGFSDVWQEKKLGEILLIDRGASPRPISSFITKSKEGIPWIKIGDTVEGSKYIEKTEEKITKEGAKKSRIVNVGDFVLSNSMSFGRPYILKIDGCIHDGWLALKNRDKNNLSNDFLYEVLTSEKIRKTFLSLAAGSAVKNLKSETVKTAKISIPNILEQQKISDFLGLTSNLIENLQSQKESFESYKKGMMQKLFSQEVRFKDDKGKEFPKWEEKKLGETIDFLSDYTANGSFASLKDNVQYYSTKNYAVLVRTTDLEKKEFEPQRFTDKRGYDFLKKTSLYGGELILANVGNTGKVYRVPKYDGYMTLAPNTYVIKFKEFMNQEFTYQWMLTEEFINKIASVVGGSGLKAINKATLRSVLINIPIIDEQQKIADFLTSIDKVIESKQQQITQAELWKKGLMQGLFV
jgi:type I restriction enzyme S subunit